MNRYIFILFGLLLSFKVSAQEDINNILRQIESNNPEIKSSKELMKSQIWDTKGTNNLENPTVSYSHMWDTKNSSETESELEVSQSFDFPTAYISRKKANKKTINALEYAYQEQRQTILLQAKEVCLDIIMLNQQSDLLKRRMEYANDLSLAYQKMLDSGDATSIEVNKIKLELLNLQTELTINNSALKNKKAELILLNGNKTIDLVDTEYAEEDLPAYALIRDEVVQSNNQLQSSQSEYESAVKQISVSKAGWLPGFEVGYKRNSGSGFRSNGVLVGVSIPIFNNRGKVSSAKANALSKFYATDMIKLSVESQAYQAYQEASMMKNQIDNYDNTLDIENMLALLNQALEGGELNMTSYFVEVATAYQSLENYIQIKNIYHKQLAKIYRHRL